MKGKRDSPGPSAMSASVDDGHSSSGAEFEVFLSFRGPDTRLSFTDNLYHSLVRAGIRVFRDNEEIRQGEKIADELLHAIKSSKIYLPIFSRGYASSVWCLGELTHMMECSSKAKDKMILPVFYDVDPDDVKLKTRLYLDALEKHEGKYGLDVPQWKEALTEVARIRGLALKGKGHGEGEIINTILDEVWNKLMKRRRNLPKHLVGIDDQVEAIMDLLTHDVPHVVIHGMGGIGKTTLASAVFNRISNQFDGCSFLSDVRESAQRGRIIDLQKQLLSEILQCRSPEIHNSDVGINIISERFRNKKVLLILDDVDKQDQLSKLAGKSDWFGPGSKIILTTRDINFLPIKEEGEESSWNQARSKEYEIYEMAEMDSSDALKLFSQHALGMDSPPPRYEDISLKITNKTGGLPLALEVIGASLFGKNRTIWEGMLRKLDSMPNQEVFIKLKISYDMLDPAQKEIFLDIACYFIGRDILHPCYMWEASGYFPKADLLILARMSLIKIEKDDTLWMHDQLRDFGRQIIQLEDNESRKRSRLWEPEIALKVLQRIGGTGKIVALRLMGLSKMQHLGSEEFSKLPNLRFLELEGGNLVGDFKNLLSELTWLSWKNCPSKLYATNLCLEKLAVLELLDTSINEDWAGWGPCLVSENLKVIHIAFCPNLMRIPDLSKCKNLERMVLHCCTTSLVIDGSISTLEQLQHLHIDGFFRGPDNGNLLAVPSALGGLRSLSRLELERMHVGELHYSVGEMTLLKYLSLQVCSLGKLPDSFGKLKSLLELNLALTGIRELPHSIGDLKMLTKMNLFMTPIKKLPDSIGGLESLIELRLVGTHITELPACIGDLKRLEILDASESNIRVLPKAIGMLENLKALKVSSRRNQGYVTFPPTDLATLSQLQVLEIYVDPRSLIGLPSSLEDLTLHNLNLPMERLPFSNLTNLARLSLENCCLREVEFEHVLGQQPEKLRILEVSSRDSLERLSVSTLKGLQMLTVFGCPGLMEIQGVEKLESLVSLRVGEGSRLRRLPDLSELKKLQNLDLGQCPLLDLPALRLPDMCYLHIYGCGNSSRFHGKYKDWKDSQYRKNHLIFSCGW